MQHKSIVGEKKGVLSRPGTSMNASTAARATPVVEPRKRIVTKNERREGERGEDDRVYQRLAGDENELFTHATSVIMHVDVKIVIITLVAL